MNKNLCAKTGNEAVAEAMRQINPDVVAAYPITPATEIAQIFSSFVADGLVDTEMVTVESEHSAMSATIGASAAGARAMTATSSQGFALMWEMVYIAAGLRLPIVMPVVNRALSSPINIHCDHSDTMGARDAGWIQIFSENAQEAYDNLIMAQKIAEDKNVLVPTMVTTDGFIISHAMEAMQLEPDDKVRAFIGEYKPENYLLNLDKPITVGGIDFNDYYFEHRRALADAVVGSEETILKVADEFAKEFGRSYDLFESYKMDDAEYAIVVLGSTAGTAKVMVDELRSQGKKVGLVKIRVFRPFPVKKLVKTLSGLKAVAVMDRSDSLAGQGGPVFGDVRNAMYDVDPKPKIVDYIYGLGGRDIDLTGIKKVFADLEEIGKSGKVANSVTYLGVRE